jgi:hypothetical protein
MAATATSAAALRRKGWPDQTDLPKVPIEFKEVSYPAGDPTVLVIPV